MEFKIIYNGPVYIEAKATSEEERKVCVKGIKHTLEDLGIIYTNENVEQAPAQDIPNFVQNSPTLERLATDKQKAFMTKLGVPFDQFTTMVEAADRINDWKVAHNYQTR